MTLDTANTARDFDVIDGAGVTVVSVKRLTLRQLKQLRDLYESRARARTRAEYVEAAKALNAGDAKAFLVLAAKANSVADPAIVEIEQDSVQGIVAALELATSVKADELERLCQCDLETMDLCRYHALGVDVDALMKAMTEARQQETKPGDTFPSTV